MTLDKFQMCMLYVSSKDVCVSPVRLCGCQIRIHMQTHTHIYNHIYIYIIFIRICNYI